MTFHLFPRAVPKSATGGADCARFQCFLSPHHPSLPDFPSAAVQQDFSAWQKSADLPVPQAYHHPASPADNPRSHHKNQQNPAKLPAPAFFCHALSGKSPPQYRSDCIFHCIAVLPEFRLAQAAFEPQRPKPRHNFPPISDTCRYILHVFCIM